MRTLISAALAALALLVTPIGVREADAQARWYPRDCHGGGSVCRRALFIQNVQRGRWITTVRGRVYVPYAMSARRSRDRSTHLCTVVVQGRLRPVCLFRPRRGASLPNG